MRRLVWFSCGAASAVAAKLAVDRYGSDCEVVYCDTMATEDKDNPRFFRDVEKWIGRNIIKISSAKYATIDEVFEKRRYMAGVSGAICTVEMKKIPREKFQHPLDVHIFGFTADEQGRADDFEEQNKSLRVESLLIEEGVTKEDCLSIVSAAGIALPAKYKHYDHNNCDGCVKATAPSYWDKTRLLTPEVFERRCKQSRAIGVKLVRIRLPGDPPTGRAPRHFLDEMPEPDPGILTAHIPDEPIDCGPACQLPLPFDTEVA